MASESVSPFKSVVPRRCWQDIILPSTDVNYKIKYDDNKHIKPVKKQWTVCVIKSRGSHCYRCMDLYVMWCDSAILHNTVLILYFVSEQETVVCTKGRRRRGEGAWSTPHSSVGVKRSADNLFYTVGFTVLLLMHCDFGIVRYYNVPDCLYRYRPTCWLSVPFFQEILDPPTAAGFFLSICFC